MQISTRFSIAVHMLLCAVVFKGQHKLTSEFLAGSIGVNPVVVRKLSGLLKKRGLLNVPPGTGGASLGRPAGEITLFDVYQAVETAGEKHLFGMHGRPNPDCPVGRNIEAALRDRMAEAQSALENALKNSTIADLAARIKK